MVHTYIHIMQYWSYFQIHNCKYAFADSNTRQRGFDRTCPTFFSYFSAVSGHLPFFLYILFSCQWSFVLLSLHTFQLSVVICPTFFTSSFTVSGHLSYFLYVLFNCQRSFVLLSLGTVLFNCQWSFVLLSLHTFQLSVVICPTFLTYFLAVSGHLSYFFYVLSSCQWSFVLLSLRTFQMSEVICPTFFTYSSTVRGHLSYFLYVLFKCRQYTLPILPTRECK